MTRDLDRRMVLIGWLPPVWLAVVGWSGWYHPWLGIGLFLVVPPLACRLISLRGPCAGTWSVAEAPARRWWLQQQFQAPFNRVPWIEEVLRLIPGLYAIWLRSWGGRVSCFAHFAPGSRVTDRQHLDIGRGAVIGSGALLGGHLLDRSEEGAWRVTVAAVTIGEGAVVGACAVLAPGSSVEPGAVLPATQRLPPFGRWQSGRRQRPGTP